MGAAVGLKIRTVRQGRQKGKLLPWTLCRCGARRATHLCRAKGTPCHIRNRLTTSPWRGCMPGECRIPVLMRAVMEGRLWQEAVLPLQVIY